jgi:hypothetical protein
MNEFDPQRRTALMALGAAALGGPFVGAAHAFQSDLPLPADAHQRVTLTADGNLISPSGAPSAPAVGGSVPWTLLTTTTSKVIKVKGYNWEVPQFPPRVKALEGRTVRVNGFYVPIESKPQSSHFFLTAFPPTCPFCLQLGSQYFVEVKAARPVAYTMDAVLMEGTLDLLEQDENVIFYRLNGAKQVKA